SSRRASSTSPNSSLAGAHVRRSRPEHVPAGRAAHARPGSTSRFHDMTVGLIPLATVRGDIANYVSTLIYVYIILIFIYVLLNLLFSTGVHPPYARWSDAVLKFLRDVCEPWLRIFRRFIPTMGMFDFSPMIAIIVLYFLRYVLVRSGGGAVVLACTLVALAALLFYFVRHPGRRGLWVPTGLLLGGAIGNLIDRLLHGSVTDFIKLPHWPAFNVADMAITFGVLALLFVLERGAAKSR